MSEFTPKDCAYMARALELAERGQYTAHPNPMVGCVLAADGELVGEGWHRKTGAAHAEINALTDAGNKARGATAYVTLSPCSHQGKTPPCTDALIKAGVVRVVTAITDPNTSVSGGGQDQLRLAGIEVQTGLMQNEAARLNRGFVQRITRQRPFVRLKMACSIDGAIAMLSGESQWITGAEARTDVHRWRARSGAVMTGIDTVLADDPSLTVRANDTDTGGLQPLRVVLDSHLRMPANAKMLTLDGETLVCTTGAHEAGPLRDAGATVATFESAGSRVNVRAVLKQLAEREINDVLVEAGPTLAGHLLEQQCVDELVIYQAPHIMGSQTQRMVSTPSWSALTDRLELDVSDLRRVGNDLRMTALPICKDVE